MRRNPRLIIGPETGQDVPDRRHDELEDRRAIRV